MPRLVTFILFLDANALKSPLCPCGDKGGKEGVKRRTSFLEGHPSNFEPSRAQPGERMQPQSKLRSVQRSGCPGSGAGLKLGRLGPGGGVVVGGDLCRLRTRGTERGAPPPPAPFALPGPACGPAAPAAGHRPAGRGRCRSCPGGARRWAGGRARTGAAEGGELCPRQPLQAVADLAGGMQALPPAAPLGPATPPSLLGMPIPEGARLRPPPAPCQLPTRDGADGLSRGAGAPGAVPVSLM